LSSPAKLLTPTKPQLIERLTSRMYPFDHLTIVYCWIIIILTVNFGRPLGDYAGTLVFHGGVIALVAALVIGVPATTNRYLLFVRLLYPVMLMTFLYRATGAVIHLIMPQTLDYRIVALEKSVFGFDLTHWFDRHPYIILTEVLSFSYFSYYLLMPGLALLLFWKRRDTDLKQFLTAACAAYFISYLMFVFIPAEGPRYFQAAEYQSNLPGVLFRPLVNYIIETGAVRGGAMPSSHVAVAVVVLVFALRRYRRRAYPLIPLVGLLTLATVHGRFHYLSDALVGAVIGLGTSWISITFYRTRIEIDREDNLPL
jgi:hypothetical protein